LNINLQKLQLLIPWDLGDYNMFFFFFGSFAPHFQIKLSIHASNFNSKFVSMSELELFLLTRVLTPNFNTMDLVKILEKNQKLHIHIIVVTLKVTSCKTMSKKIKLKIVKNQDFMGKTNKILRSSYMQACG
jgi:hypothetical protein